MRKHTDHEAVFQFLGQACVNGVQVRLENDAEKGECCDITVEECLCREGSVELWREAGRAV